MQIIPARIRNLWSAEEIRILVLASLFLQVVLIFLSVFRRRWRNKLLSLLLWSAYLGADYVATLALGHLLGKQDEAMEESSTGDIMAFWSPFLLLHLGGPDTITAYSLEDNELWRRHFLGLVLKVLTAIFVFLKSLPSPHLWAVTIVVFASGSLKYVERTWSLRSASKDQLRAILTEQDRPGPDCVRLMQEYQSRPSAGLEATIQIKEPDGVEKARIADKEIILWAHRFFGTFKRLTVDLVLSFKDQTESQNFFLDCFPRQAFRVVEVELSFLYDILHTKAHYVHSFTGRIRRTLSLTMAVLALVLFHRSKHPFNPTDVIITYVLLIAALVLETVSIVLLIFSDWTIVALQQSQRPWRQKILSLILKIRTFVLGYQKKRSNSMGQYSLIRICFKDYNITGNRRRLKRLVEFLQLEELWYARYVNHVDFSDDAQKLVFQELKSKATSAQRKPKGSKAHQGECVLREKGYGTNIDWSTRDFNESILLWHIATYLCYYQEEEEEEEKDIIPGKLETKIMEKIKKIFERIISVGKRDRQRADYKEKIKEELEVDDRRKISKEISDYMMYLVMFQPAMLPTGIEKIRFQNFHIHGAKAMTSISSLKLLAKIFFSENSTEMDELAKEEKKKEQAKSVGGSSDHAVDNIPHQRATTDGVIMKISNLIKRCLSWNKPLHSPTSTMEIKKQLKKDKKLFLKKEKLACGMLLEVGSTLFEGDWSKSILCDACKLSNTIMDIKKETDIWVIISTIWVEILCCAASNYTAYAHAKQLSQGEELLTHIWLLMVHMGIEEQYRSEVRAKSHVRT